MAEYRDLAYEACADHMAVQKVDELATIAAVVRSHVYPRTVLELGSEYGGTLWFWQRIAAPDALVVSVDFNQQKNRTLEPYADQGLVLLEADTHDPDTLVAVEDCLGGHVDLLFVDANHEYEDVRDDWRAYSPLLGPHGVAVFHDTVSYAHTVRRLIEEEVERERSVIYIES